MRIIGVAGQLANGKDVLCDYLADKLNFNQKVWERTAFANAVKDVYCNSFNKTRQFIEDWKRNPEPPPGMLMNVRKGLQVIGDGFRQIQGDIWIDIALRDESRNLIISDSRYINEAKAIKAKGGFTLIIYRPGFLNNDPNPSESQIGDVVRWCVQNNVKEGFIPVDNRPEILTYYDYFLINDGTLDDLYAKVDRQLIPIIKEFYNEDNNQKGSSIR